MMIIVFFSQTHLCSHIVLFPFLKIPLDLPTFRSFVESVAENSSAKGFHERELSHGFPSFSRSVGNPLSSSRSCRFQAAEPLYKTPAFSKRLDSLEGLSLRLQT